jgi:predicted metal-dependent hydrolase
MSPMTAPAPDPIVATTEPPTPAPPPAVRVVRSPQRRKTVTAYRDGDTVVVQLPARLSQHEQDYWVAHMLQRLEQRERRQPPTDQALQRRALLLARRHFDGAVQPASVRWVTNMRARYGSCTPTDRTIRLSDRIAPYPAWVRDYVLVHELAHLAVPDHSAAFWALVDRYPMAERARGFLIAKGLEDHSGGDHSGGDHSGGDHSDGDHDGADHRHRSPTPITDTDHRLAITDWRSPALKRRPGVGPRLPHHQAPPRPAKPHAPPTSSAEGRLHNARPPPRTKPLPSPSQRLALADRRRPRPGLVAARAAACQPDRHPRLNESVRDPLVRLEMALHAAP